MAPVGMAFRLVFSAIAVTLIAEATNAVPEVATPVPWSEYFFQTFYHLSIIPVLLLTVVIAWMARPSTQEEIPDGFKQFQFAYLSVWSICVAADWLQGPYVYALYSAYGFTGHEIAQLFVAGFGSSLVFGCVVGPLTDRFGRKKTCLAYCVFYIMSCCTKHFQNYNILMFGRITGGIATSMLFSAFECWLVSEHCSRHQFSNGLLSYMFGLMFTVMYCVAIISGLAAQFVADTFAFTPMFEGSSFHMGGYCGPFDLAILCLLIGMVLIAFLWEENYGSSEENINSHSVLENLVDAGRILRADKNVLLMGVIVSCFEGSMFAFVFNWTPALDSKEVPPPHGVIFALFMMACMCGASMATIVGNSIKPHVRLVATFSVSIASFCIMAIVGGGAHASLKTCFVAFLVFEFCVGIYFPTIGVMKSDVVPEHVRGTVYNLYRVPLNAVVVALLLSNISMIKCFGLCAFLLTVALFAVVSIWVSPRAKLNPEEASLNKPAKQV